MKTSSAIDVSKFRAKLVATVFSCCCLNLIVCAQAAPVRWLSSNTNFSSATANGNSTGPFLSRNGQHLVFTSEANNLVAGDHNHIYPDIFHLDFVSNVLQLISVTTNGSNGGNNVSAGAQVSDDGSVVVFESEASDLVNGDTNGVSDIFLRNLLTQTTTRLSPQGLDNRPSQNPALTPDGRYVVFESRSRLISGEAPDGDSDIYFRDLQSEGLRLLSGSLTPRVDAHRPRISDDGSVVVFETRSGNMAQDVYVWTNSQASAQPISVSRIDASEVILNPSVSADGRIACKGLKVVGTQLSLRIFIHEPAIPQTTLIYSNLTVRSGYLVDPDGYGPCLSRDGSTIVFIANDQLLRWNAGSGILPANVNLDGNNITNLLSPQLSTDGKRVLFSGNVSDTNGFILPRQLFVHDLVTGGTELVSRRINGEISSKDTAMGVLTSAGTQVAFVSADEQIVENDNNRAFDIFIKNLTNSMPVLVSARNPQLAAGSPSFSVANSGGTSTNGLLVYLRQGTNSSAFQQVYARQANGSTLLISRNTNGIEHAGQASSPQVSEDGNYVVYTSTGRDLTQDDPNPDADVFRYDVARGETQRVSTNSFALAEPRVSGNGQLIAFRSQTKPYLTDMVSGLTTELPVNVGVLGDLAISAKGEYVVYDSGAKGVVWDVKGRSNLVSSLISFKGPVINADGTVLAARVYGNLEILSLPSLAVLARVTNVVFVEGSFSRDGSLFAFTTLGHIQQRRSFALNIQNGIVTPITPYFFEPLNRVSSHITVDRDGSRVAFRSAPVNLVSNEPPAISNVYLYDVREGITQLISGENKTSSYGLNVSGKPQFADGDSSLIFNSTGFYADGDGNGNLDIYASLLPTRILLRVGPGQEAIGLEWKAVPAVSYRVVYKNNLNDAAWVDLGQPITTNGEVASTTDPARNTNSQRFYRVEQQ